MKRYFVVLAILLAGPAFARSATFSLFGKAADGVSMAVQHDVVSYKGFLGSEVSRFASVGIVAALATGGMHAEGAAASPGGSKSLEELQRDYRALSEERDSYGAVPGLGLIIAGGIMVVLGIVLGAVVGGIVSNAVGLALGGGAAAAQFGFIGIIFWVLGGVIGLVGAILLTVGIIKLIVGLSNRGRLANEMEELEKQINTLKGGAPAAPAAKFGMPEASMTLASF